MQTATYMKQPGLFDYWDPGFSEGGGGGGGGANDGKGEGGVHKAGKLLPLMFVTNNKILCHLEDLINLEGGGGGGTFFNGELSEQDCGLLSGN